MKKYTLDTPTVQLINNMVDRRIQGAQKSTAGSTLDDADRDARAYSARISIVIRNARTSLFSHLVAAVLFVAFAFPYINTMYLAAWFLAITTTTGVRWMMQRRANVFTDLVAQAKWLRNYVIGAVIAGLLWSSAGIIAITSTSDEARILAVFLMAGISAGAVPLIGSLIGVYTLVVAAIFLPMTAVALSPWYQGGWSLGAVSLVFMITMIQLAGRYSSTVGQAIQSDHDILTNLLNRRAFERILRNFLREERTPADSGVLCYMDIDRFKYINDTYGHAAGDRLIRKVALTMERSMRSQDILARFGGDEFAMLLRDCSVEEGRQVTERLRKKIENLVCEWQGRRINATVSIGIVAVLPDATSLSELASAADTALYSAKHRGRNCVHVHDYGDELERLRREEIAWVRQLREGYVDKRLRLGIQKIFDVSAVNESEAPDAERYEMLLRLITEQGQVISAGRFMKAADHYGMSPVLDRWVLTHTVQWLRRNAANQNNLAWCAVNLSASTIADTKFIEFVRAELLEKDVAATKICFEISESVLIENFAVAAEFIKSAVELGCRVSIDDFGTALSSFSYLGDLPADYIKIDGQFVQRMKDDAIAKTMVRAIGELGHVMGKKTVAEFVEDKDVLLLLNDIGIDFAQGFGLDEPKVIEIDDDSENQAA